MGTGVVNRVLDCVNSKVPFLTFRRTLATASFLKLDPALHSMTNLSQINQRLAMIEEKREKIQEMLVESATLLRSWERFRSELSYYLVEYLDSEENKIR